MSLLLACDIPERIMQVLADFLPTELDSIDTAMADGMTTPDIPAANYSQWEQGMVPEYPACVIRAVSSSPVDVKPDTFGQRVDAFHRFDVMFTVSRENANTAGDDSPLGMQKLLMRYIAGAVRVLAIMHEGLQTALDPTRVVTVVNWTEAATYGPDTEQADGSVVRTATLPIEVRLIEAR
jgi:hypothetical protein